MSSKKTVAQHAEDDHRHADVEPVPLEGKGYHGAHDTCHGGGDQQQQAQLDNPTAAECPGIGENARNTTQLLWLAPKTPIEGQRGPVTDQIQAPSYQHHDGRDEHTTSQEIANKLLCL